MKNTKGITLIVLVITIVILLILAGIAIGTLTGENGLFARAQQAKEQTQEAQKKENIAIDNYIEQIDNITLDNKLVDKVNSGEINIGDYIKYKPAAIEDEELKKLKIELKTYSGSNLNEEIEQEDLNWQVLDVQNGKVRLISELPTKTAIVLSGANGYNNAVKLLDNIANRLYNSNLAYNVQNIKIENIQEKMNEKDYTKFNSNYWKIVQPVSQYYPTILEKEKEQTVGENIGKEIGISEQNELINQTSKIFNTLKLRDTYWMKEMLENDFKNQKYYELFIRKGQNNLEYWISSRCINVDSQDARFLVRLVTDNKIRGGMIYDSTSGVTVHTHSFRPIVTLNSDVQIDIKDSENGSSAVNGYSIK